MQPNLPFTDAMAARRECLRLLWYRAVLASHGNAAGAERVRRLAAAQYELGRLLTTSGADDTRHAGKEE